MIEILLDVVALRHLGRLRGSIAVGGDRAALLLFVVETNALRWCETVVTLARTRSVVRVVGVGSVVAALGVVRCPRANGSDGATAHHGSTSASKGAVDGLLLVAERIGVGRDAAFTVDATTVVRPGLCQLASHDALTLSGCRRPRLTQSAAVRADGSRATDRVALLLCSPAAVEDECEQQDDDTCKTDEDTDERIANDGAVVVARVDGVRLLRLGPASVGEDVKVRLEVGGDPAVLRRWLLHEERRGAVAHGCLQVANAVGRDVSLPDGQSVVQSDVGVVWRLVGEQLVVGDSASISSVGLVEGSKRQQKQSYIKIKQKLTVATIVGMFPKS